MSIIIQTEAISNARGEVHLCVPNNTPNSRLAVKVEIDSIPGAERFSRRFATRQEYLEALDKVFAVCDDPTFMPPADEALRDIEPL